MNDHIRHLLIQRQYSEDIKDEAIVRVLFNGESVVEVAESLEIHSVQVINHWVNAYRKKIEEGLITLAPMTDKQKRDLHILQQRNKELERAVKEANLMILALNSLIDVAEQDLKISIRKKRGTKASRSWAEPYFSCPIRQKWVCEYPPGILYSLNISIRPIFSILDSILRSIVYNRQTNL